MTFSILFIVESKAELFKEKLRVHLGHFGKVIFLRITSLPAPETGLRMY